MVPGFSKCGTTTLCDLLAKHPDIFIPSMKEANFFVHDSYQDNWQRYFDFYRLHNGEKMIGEGGTFYTGALSEVASRTAILKHYPQVKLIFIARDPIDRLESSFRELHHSGAKFGMQIPFTVAETLASLPSFLDDNRYWSRFQNYRQHMEGENIHVLFLEDLQRDPQQELTKCYQFLGVDQHFQGQNEVQALNQGTSKYFDTRLLRRMRKNPYIGFQLQGMGFEKQNRLAIKMGLRRPFKKPIQWEQDTLRWLIGELSEEIEQFLAYSGKPQDIWPRFHQYVAQFNS